MSALEYTIWIEATPEQVWLVYADPVRIPDWQTGKPVVAMVQGPPGVPGSTYVSRRGPLAARTTVLSANPPHELVTRTDAYLGLSVEVSSRLIGHSGGTDLRLHATTQWRRRLGPVSRIVEMAILSPREARKELTNLKVLVERQADSV
ncbi:SRPBCC family protein [Pedococcus sp. P5_B7]